MKAIVALVAAFAHAAAFSVPTVNPFTAEAWTKLQTHLDTLPVFICVNADGEPLGYAREDGEGSELSVYFADVERAKAELAMMSEKFPSLDLRIIGVGLGAAFKQATEGDSILVPSEAALRGAGEEWDSATLPLYTCLAMSSPAAEGCGLPVGEPTTPFFLCPKDAQASLDAALEAVKARGGATEEQLAALQLMVTSMPQAVDLVLTGKEAETCGDRFQFVAPRSSLTYLREQLATQKTNSARRALPDDKFKRAPQQDDRNLLFP